MRVRIGAQAFAITAMVIGLITANPAVKKTDEWFQHKANVVCTDGLKLWI